MTKLTKQQRELMAHEASHNANCALVMSVVGIFILGIVLEPVALYYAIKSKRTLRTLDNNDNSSYAKAIIALILSGVFVGVICLAFIVEMMSVL